MAGLFLLFLIVVILTLMKKRDYAFSLAIITVFLCIGMLIHHATSVLQVRL